MGAESWDLEVEGSVYGGRDFGPCSYLQGWTLNQTKTIFIISLLSFSFWTLILDKILVVLHSKKSPFLLQENSLRMRFHKWNKHETNMPRYVQHFIILWQYIENKQQIQNIVRPNIVAQGLACI